MDIEVIITKQDYENSSKEYIDNDNCPAATAIKRTLGRDDIRVDPCSVEEGGIWKYNMVPYFNNDSFEKLENGTIDEFKMVLQAIE